MNLDPDGIKLDSPSKSFSYEKISREIEDCESIETLRLLLRCYVKLYLKQQETITNLGTLPSPINDGDS